MVSTDNELGVRSKSLGGFSYLSRRIPNKSEHPRTGDLATESFAIFVWNTPVG
jgi:hypothetical protein